MIGGPPSPPTRDPDIPPVGDVRGGGLGCRRPSTDQGCVTGALALSTEALTRDFVDATAALVCITDRDGRIVLANPALQRFAGRTAEDLTGRFFWDVYVVPEDVERAQAAAASALAGGTSFTAEGDWLAADGERRRIAMQNGVLRDAADRPYAIACVGIDVTEERRRQALMHRLATTDSLTDAHNRGGLFAALDEHLDGVSGRGCGLLFCDLDNFKAVNDRHGHAVGDRLLVEVASRLRSVAGPDGLVARFGGDEFVVLTPNPDRDDLDALAARIEERMRPPLETSAGALPIGVSIGGATAHPGEHPDDLVARADRAMYRVKAHRREQVR